MTSMFKQILLLSFFAHSATCFAIINIEAIRSTPFNGTKGEVAMSLSGKQGNSETADYLAEGLVYSKSESSEKMIILSYKYGESQEIKDENKSNLHLRYGRSINKNLSWETFGQIESDEFTRLSFRGLLGAGVRWAAYKSDSAQIHIGVGGFASQETLKEKTGATDDGTENINRSNIYLSFYLPINKKFTWSNVTYFQSNLGRIEDHRIFEKMTLDLKVFEKLSVGAYLQVAHDNEPPQLVKTTDSEYGTKISYSF